MKARYKLLIIVILLWMGMTYEGSRNVEPISGNRQNVTLEEQIRLYELGLIDEYPQAGFGDSDILHSTYQGNWFARSGRSIGHTLQTVVRETLRGIVRFFDGIIT
jgi:hypothetical protein